MRKTIPVLVAAIVLPGALTGCSGASQKPTTPTPSVAEPSRLATARFAAPATTGTQPATLTYDPALVPAAGTATVAAVSTQNGSAVTLSVNGLPANHEYGAHVHTKQCGPQPADAG